MALSADTMARVIAQLRADADAADAVIADKSSNWMTRVVSGDDGDAERYAVKKVRELADVLEKTAARDRDRDTTDTWLQLAQQAEATLTDVKGYRLSTTAAQIAKDTAAQTAADVKDAAASAADALAAIIPWQLYVVVAVALGGFLVLRFGIKRGG